MNSATQTLPQSYILYRHFDETKYKKAYGFVLLLGILIFFISFTIFNSIVGILRPEYQTVERLQFQLTIDRLLNILRLIPPVVVTIAIHEAFHAFFLWLYTKKSPSLVIMVKGIFGIGIRMPAWYISRDAFLVANLAPAVLVTSILLILILIVPGNLIGFFVFCATFNVAGSISDLCSSFYIFLLPRNAYLNTDGSVYHDQLQAEVPEIVRRLRLMIEMVVNKFE